MAKERLDKLVAAAGGYTRSEARRCIKIGQVSVNGAVVRSFGILANPQSEVICIAGKEIIYQKYVYLMMNKPQGVICATEGQHYQTVVDLVPEELRRPGLFPAGRLDKDTTGFVLITDDGGFAHAILSPRRHVDKTYEARLDKPITSHTVAAFEAGVVCGDGTVFQSAGLTVIDQEGLVARVVICEGKYHQIKRMFAACGHHVEALHRTRIGKLDLDASLVPGMCRPITKEEIEKITKKS